MILGLGTEASSFRLGFKSLRVGSAEYGVCVVGA